MSSSPDLKLLPLVPINSTVQNVGFLIGLSLRKHRSSLLVAQLMIIANRAPISPGILVLTLLLGYILCLGLRKNLKDKEGHSIPPGPPLRYPFLPKYPERILHRWTKQYGPIYSVWMGNQLFVVLNDPIVARDLLVVHGSNFSSRHNYFMKNQTILDGGAITATPYNDTW